LSQKASDFASEAVLSDFAGAMTNVTLRYDGAFFVAQRHRRQGKLKNLYSTRGGSFNEIIKFI
jgi:hypothetical protein